MCIKFVFKDVGVGCVYNFVTQGVPVAFIWPQLYNGGQKISSTTVIPLTYAVKQPLGMDNLTSHIDMCVNQFVSICILMDDTNKFQIVICKRKS
jgi:hypothetical protein